MHVAWIRFLYSFIDFSYSKKQKTALLVQADIFDDRPITLYKHNQGNCVCCMLILLLNDLFF